MIWALIISAAFGGPLRFDRVDLIAEDPALWVNDDLARLPQVPRLGPIRYLSQVKVVIELPMEGVYFGTSLSSQSIVAERLIVSELPIYGYSGIQAGLFLPRGIMGGLAYREGPLRVGIGFSALSSATWRRPDWSVWSWLPSVGIGIGRSHPVLEAQSW
jgi:hypothetical protein